MLSTKGTALTQKQERALQAAQWMLEAEHQQQSGHVSLRVAADKFGVSKMSVSRQLHALKSGKANAGVKKVGRPQNLTDAEQEILSFHLLMLRRDYPGKLTAKSARSALNVLLALRKPPTPAAYFSDSWLKKFMQKSHRRLLQDPALMSLPNNNDQTGASQEMDLDDDNEIGDENGGPLENPAAQFTTSLLELTAQGEFGHEAAPISDAAPQLQTQTGQITEAREAPTSAECTAIRTANSSS